jgi:hypothetical protein
MLSAFDDAAALSTQRGSISLSSWFRTPLPGFFGRCT